MGWKMTLQHHFIYRHSLHTDSFEETTFSHAATRRGKGNKRFLESPWTQFHGITGIGFKLTLFSERSLCSNKESRSRTLKERERELERVWHLVLLPGGAAASQLFVASRSRQTKPRQAKFTWFGFGVSCSQWKN